MAKAPGKGNIKPNEGKQGMQPDYKGFIMLDRDYKEGEYLNFGVWKNDYNGFNLRVNKPMADKNQQEYPRPVHKEEIPF